MDANFSGRMGNIKKSFIREILKAIDKPGMISFAGGLPNPISFPIEDIKNATSKVLDADGENVLQYSTTEGYLPLRKIIAQRYKKRFDINISPEEVLITNGSQQALDLMGKVFLDKGDGVVTERPAYLGMIQAMSVFEPKFYEARLNPDGIDTQMLFDILKQYDPKLFYSVPNFQNPTGITYSGKTRQQTADIITGKRTVLIEDDPYGELRFIGEDEVSFKKLVPENTVTLGSFSKIVSPGMRLGWVVAPPEIMDKLITVKQASDLHSNYFTQRVVCQYLMDNDIDEHIAKIKALYKSQRDLMVEMIAKHFPNEVHTTKPEGGMFLWATLPEGISSLKVFEKAYEQGVAFVPGNPFFACDEMNNTFRLNYSNSDKDAIEKGIRKIGRILKELI